MESAPWLNAGPPTKLTIMTMRRWRRRPGRIFSATQRRSPILEAAARRGALTNGWLIAGGRAPAKRRSAFRLARLLLAGDDAAKAKTLIAANAHPDLFVAERLYDEKTERLASEISVETIRRLTQFLTRTPSLGDWRVAIVDTADALNRNAANALLKALEEPPPRTTLFLLSVAPGRLLATIRSRCRKVSLPPWRRTGSPHS